MDYFHESINYSEDIYANLFLHSVNYVRKHWHNSYEMLFILSGAVEINIEDKNFKLNSGSIILINPNEIHALKNIAANSILCLHIAKNIIYEHTDKNDITFKCCFYDENTEDDKDSLELKEILAEMTYISSKRDTGYKLAFKSLLFKLIYILIKKYSILNPKKTSINSQKHMDRLSLIINYVKENINEDISLKKYAEKFGLTPQYFASFFQRYMGESFISYVNNMRVQNAHRDLIYTDYTILSIAEKNGFRNIKSFNTAFKKKIGDTPSNIRKRSKEKNPLKYSQSSMTPNYFEIHANNFLEGLYKYLNHDKGAKLLNTTSSFASQYDIYLNNKNQRIHHLWKNIIGVGRAYHLLEDHIKIQLTRAKKDIGFKFVRFHGIFEDDLMICSEKKDGSLIFNFSNIDRIFDFLLSIDMKPFIELCFLPYVLAKEHNHIFYKKCYISMPKNMKDWEDLIRELIVHLIRRYGMNEVLSWYFEFWNEPDCEGFMWYDSFEDYINFYKVTYKVIKDINKDFKIGAPTIISMSLYDSDWLFKYLKSCMLMDIIPDFITFHSYPLEIKEEFKDDKSTIFKEQNISNIKISDDEKYLMNFIKDLKDKMKNLNLGNLPIVCTEWNSTAWHRDLCSDTCYKSAYIVKNVLETMDMIEGMAYWMLSDYSWEMFPDDNIFHGGLGLFTQNGIRKASYNAFCLLNKLGSTFIDKGEIYYVTKKEEEYQILLYNYCHYDREYSNFDTSKISLNYREGVFKGYTNKNITLNLKDIIPGLYKLKFTYISKISGSSYDIWVNSGSPKEITLLEEGDLDDLSSPKFNLENRYLDENSTIDIHLSPNEVLLIQMRKI